MSIINTGLFYVPFLYVIEVLSSFSIFKSHPEIGYIVYDKEIFTDINFYS